MTVKNALKRKFEPNKGNLEGSKTVRVTCSTADSLDLDKILPIQGDLKSLSDADFKKLRASILKYGISFPSYIWKNNGSASCIDGHQRNRVLSEMRKGGYRVPPVPVVYVEARDEKEAKEKILLLSSQYGKYTMESVYEFMANSQIDFGEIKDIIDLPQFDLDKFERGYFTEPVEEGPEPRFDEAEELRQKYGVELGQVWALGEHRLMCGDSTDAELVSVLISEKVRLVWTDPPYGVHYGAKLEAANPMHYRVRSIENDDLNPEELESLLHTSFINAAALSIPGAAIYVACPAGTLLPSLIKSFDGSGFVFHWGLVWVKDQIVLGRGDYHFKHENILYGWKDDGPHYFTPDRTQASVFDVPRPKASPEHPTMKPVALVSRMIDNSSCKEDGVYDPFLGSGTTLIACEQLNRRCYAMEISPAYVAVAIQRWVDLTGKAPKLAN